MMSMQSIRSFIGIDFDENTKAAFLKIQREKLKLHEFTSVKVVNPGTAHITLSFLGQIGLSEASRLSEALRSISYHPFCVTFRGVDVFPNKRRMRVIYIGILPSEDLKELYGLLTAALPKKYFPDRRFDPHVTVGRVKRFVPSELNALAHTVSALSTYHVGRFNVSAFQLKKSTLTPKGPIYETLEEFRL